MGQQHDHRRLAHIGGLAAHVGAGDQQHAAAVIQQAVVGDEGLFQHLLHYQVAPGGDVQGLLDDEFGFAQGQALGPLGQGSQHVQFADRGGGLLQRYEDLVECVQKAVIKQFFPGQGAAFGRQRLVLEFLELRGDIALGVLQGLSADVFVGRVLRLGLADLDVVAVNPVVAHFQGGDAGALFFPALDLQQEVAGPGGDGAQLVEFLVVAVGDHAAVAQHHRRVLDNGRFQQVDGIRVLPALSLQGRQQWRLAAVEFIANGGQGGQ